MKGTGQTILRTIGVMVAALAAFIAYVYVHNLPLPATADDPEILKRARVLFEASERWSKAGNRDCDEEATWITLYCALRQASLDVTGTFEHRAAALEQVRHQIDVTRPGNDYAHRLRDFNNDPSVTRQDVTRLLERAAAELENQATGDTGR